LHTRDGTPRPRDTAHVAAIATLPDGVHEMAAERRDAVRRRQVFQKVVSHVVENPKAAFNFDGFRSLLGVPEPAARRILGNLVSAGVVAEIERGLWTRTWSDVCARRSAAGEPTAKHTVTSYGS
jgi:hypothetical protein